MWIRTQNKKELVYVIKLEITVEMAFLYGDKKNKVILWGRFAADSIFSSSNRVLLGMYPTMEDAITEIDKIEKCILNNPNSVYTMKSNE